VSQLETFGRRYGLSILIGGLAVEVALEVAFRESAKDPRTTAWFTVPAIAAMVLTLLGRWRFAFAAPAALWLTAAALSFVDGRLVVFPLGADIAGFAASFLLGNLSDRAQARFGLAIVVGAAAIVVYNDPAHSAGEFVFIPLLFAIGWLAGYALRERTEHADLAEARAAQAERERDAAARLAVAEERARIARELHDIVAHALSVMVLQVGAVRRKLPKSQEEDRAALEGVEQAGRTALTEMRHLLGAMRLDSDELELAPQPGLDHLNTLVEEIERAGLTVQLHVEGEPVKLPAAIDLSAYRIIQEGLTNALKHADAEHAKITLQYQTRHLSIQIRDDGHGAAADNGAGFGLIGIRERVKILGGEMTAHNDPDGGFMLTTRLPVTRSP
jgi:signal transduction histidine kinase